MSNAPNFTINNGFLLNSLAEFHVPVDSALDKQVVATQQLLHDNGIFVDHDLTEKLVYFFGPGACNWVFSDGDEIKRAISNCLGSGTVDIIFEYLTS